MGGWVHIIVTRHSLILLMLRGSSLGCAGRGVVRVSAPGHLTLTRGDTGEPGEVASSQHHQESALAAIIISIRF